MANTVADIRISLRTRSITSEQWAHLRKRAGAPSLELDEMRVDQLERLHALVKALPQIAKGKP